MKTRLELARVSNPFLKNTQKEFAIRVAESGLYLAVMGNVTTGRAPKKYAVSLSDSVSNEYLT